MDRTTQNSHPDSQSVAAFYGPLVSSNGGVSSQQGSPTTYGYGYPVLYRDEVGKLRQEWLDGFGRVIEVDEPSSDNSQSSASITINGTEEHTIIQKCLRWLQGGDCERWENETIYDTGTVSITVDGVEETVSYGSSSTSSTIASALASAFNGNGSSPVTASASGSVISFLSKASGPGTEYGFTASSKTNDPTDFGSASFYPTPASGSLTNDGATGSLSTPVATFYQYDAADHVVKVIQGVQTRTYAYDGLERPVSITTPEAGTVTLAYTNSRSLCSGDPNNVCQRTDARGVQTYFYYDQLNRLTGKSYTVPSGVAAMPNVCTTQTGQSANVCYSYDQGGAGAYALGRRTEMVDPSGSETYTYDAAGRITQLAKVIGSNTYTIKYQYNAGDELTQITYPSGRVVQLSYDVVGQTCEIAPSTTSCGTAGSPYATGYSYNAAGQLTGFKYGNGIYGSFGYSSNRSQLNCLDYSTTNRSGTCTHDSTTNFGLNYYYAQDPNYCANGTPGDDGKIECTIDATSTSIVPGANGRTATYSYDALGRLSTASTTGSPQFPQWGVSESYDQYGNRWSQAVTLGTGPMSSLSFANPGGAQTNRPDGWCFDASGNLLAKSGSCPPAYPNFVYDGENRMVGDPTANWTYVYDGNGTRVEKCTPNCSSPSSSVAYIFSGSRDVAEYNNGAGAGSPSTEFIYSDAIPGAGLLASVSNGSITYFQSDHLDWRVATNASGQVTGTLSPV